METELYKITLEELCKTENFSVRSFNVCDWNNLRDLKSILDFYLNNGNFLSLKNCGQKSNLELIDICKKYEKAIKDTDIILNDIKPKNLLIEKINGLTSHQKSIIHNILVSNFNFLSNRSQHALLSFLDNSITLKNLENKIFSNLNFKISEIRNIGNISENEISTFLNNIKTQITNISNITDDKKIEVELFKAFIINYFSLNDSIIQSFDDVLSYPENLPLFKIIEILIENNIIVDYKTKLIFKNEFSLLSHPKNLSEIANELRYTRERARQIRVQLIRRFSSIFNFICHPEIKSLLNYGIDYNGYHIIISDEMVDFINFNERVNYNKLFVTRIFAQLYDTNFDLIGRADPNTLQRNNSIRQWDGSYIIEKQLNSYFDFNLLFDDVNLKLSDKIEEDYFLHFQSYLLNFFRVKNYDTIDKIAEVAEYILFNEFEIIIDTDENICFKRNVKKQVIEYVYEVLEEKNEPLNVNEIFKIIELKYPGITKSPESLRGCCQGDANLIFFGRSSTYGLKKWEEELNIKGGTIRDIAEEFLQDQSEPKHIDDITEFVNHYRDTNSKNIYANLKMDESKRFVFYSGTYIGLTSKKYLSDKFIETNSINKSARTWEDSFEILKEFALKNNRLPYSSGSEEEAKIYRFLNIQLRKDKNDDLDSDKSFLIKDLIYKYNYKVRKRHRNSD